MYNERYIINVTYRGQSWSTVCRPFYLHDQVQSISCYGGYAGGVLSWQQHSNRAKRVASLHHSVILPFGMRRKHVRTLSSNSLLLHTSTPPIDLSSIHMWIDEPLIEKYKNALKQSWQPSLLRLPFLTLTTFSHRFETEFKKTGMDTHRRA